MVESIVKNKARDFAIKVVKLYKYLCDEKHEYVLSKQLLRAGTSIGANVCEAVRGQSTADFYAKMTIALKEAAETDYWLDLLNATDYIDAEMFTDVNSDCQEIIKVLTSITKTTKEKMKK